MRLLPIGSVMAAGCSPSELQVEVTEVESPSPTCATVAAPAACELAAFECGVIVIADACGVLSAVTCGECVPPAVCNGDQRCEVVPEPDQPPGVRPAPARPVVAAALDRGLYIDSKGGLSAWGGPNTYGELGVGDTTPRSTPTKVCGGACSEGLSGVVAVSGGQDFSLALKTDGTVWSWGADAMGQLGRLGATPCLSDRCDLTPLPVAELTDVVAISASNAPWGGFALALKSDGTVWAWGYNLYGVLGVDAYTLSRSFTPVQVPGLTNIVAVAAGYIHALALDADGTVWAWGQNADGQVGGGDNAEATITVPRQVAYVGGAIAIAAGGFFSLAMTNAQVVGWGRDASQELGGRGLDTCNSGRCSRTPVVIIDERPTAALAAGSYHGLLLAGDGTLWTWGSDGWGELGDGTSQAGRGPAMVPELNGVIGVGAGYGTSYAVRVDGTVWAWGRNDSAQLGLGGAAFDTCPDGSSCSVSLRQIPGL